MKLYPSIPPNLADWAIRQPVFLTASAPTHAAHVNVSPKGLAAHIAFLGPNLVAYIDRTGSGCETIAHSYENGRLTLMFMSFGTIPRILRLFCRSRVVESDAPDFDDWVRRVAGETGRTKEDLDGARAVIICDVWEVQTSCGYGVPVVKKGIYAPGKDTPALIEEDDGKQADELSVFEDRRTLDDNWRRRALNGTIEEYQAQTNTESIDGLPGLRTARRTAGESLLLTDFKARIKRAAAEVDGIALGIAVSLVSLGIYHGVTAFMRQGRF
ncbi:hypothetical protein F5X68DRAFT_214023 [Plectosphaerella plurivora]|uniref:Pyridoxamine phosphate oxidase family protein n=1 Tax=Plectosphaerella plurivora TaxID=936078 RepID=A0A9P9A8Z7_9PEZI|nr:hypothetical protein F5X68DRAFT_214023 [Plectosphaerella plurivora]